MCNHGYRAVGNNLIQCEPDFEWDKEIGTCERKCLKYFKTFNFVLRLYILKTVLKFNVKK